MAPTKVLLAGPVCGRLDTLYARVATVNSASGPFDVLFCVGQFLPDGALRSMAREGFENARMQGAQDARADPRPPTDCRGGGGRERRASESSASLRFVFLCGKRSSSCFLLSLALRVALFLLGVRSNLARCG